MVDHLIITNTMPPRIPETTRWEVIEKWMLGYPRNTIAAECGVSNGAVTSIVDEWRRSTGLQVATIIRETGVTLRRLGMTPAQCATGLRISKLLEKMGLDESSAESFLAGVYTKCQSMGVNPDHIAKYANGLVSLFLEDGTEDQEQKQQLQQSVVSMEEIDTILEHWKQAKIGLDEEIQGMTSKLRSLQEKALESETALRASLEARRKVESDLNWKSDLKNELERNGLDVNDLSKLVEAAGFFKASGVRINDVLKEFLHFKDIKGAITAQEQHIELLKQQSHDLGEEVKIQVDLLEEKKYKNMELDELKKLGFGLWNLKTLRNLVTELAIENEEAAEGGGEALKIFFSDIENHYPDYLRLRDKVNRLRADETALRGHIRAMDDIGPAISSFLQMKPTQDDIREVIELLEGSPRLRLSNKEDLTQDEPKPVEIDSKTESHQSKPQNNMIPPDFPTLPEPKRVTSEKSTEGKSTDQDK